MLRVEITKLEDMLVIFDGFIFKFCPVQVFNDRFLLFLPFVTVKGRRERRLKWEGTRITGWKRIIQDLLA